MRAIETIVETMARQDAVLKVEAGHKVTLQDRYGRRLGHHVLSSIVCDSRIFDELLSSGMIQEIKDLEGGKGERFYELSSVGLQKVL